MNLGNMPPLEFIEFLAAELKLDYEFYKKKVEVEPRSNTAYDYLNGYVDYCEETGGLVERYLRQYNEQ